MYAELLIPKEFEELYLEIAGDDKQLQLHEFRDFLRDYQKETHYSDEQIKQMILDYEKTDLDSTTDIGMRLSLYAYPWPPNFFPTHDITKSGPKISLDQILFFEL